MVLEHPQQVTSIVFQLLIISPVDIAHSRGGQCRGVQIATDKDLEEVPANEFDSLLPGLGQHTIQCK